MSFIAGSLLAVRCCIYVRQKHQQLQIISVVDKFVAVFVVTYFNVIVFIIIVAIVVVVVIIIINIIIIAETVRFISEINMTIRSINNASNIVTTTVIIIIATVAWNQGWVHTFWDQIQIQFSKIKFKYIVFPDFNSNKKIPHQIKYTARFYSNTIQLHCHF